MYGCNSLTLLNLLFLYIDKRVSFDENNQRFAYQDTSFSKKFKWFFVIFFLIYNLTTKVLLIKKKNVPVRQPYKILFWSMFLLKS
jgi:hypothetical protein